MARCASPATGVGPTRAARRVSRDHRRRRRGVLVERRRVFVPVRGHAAFVRRRALRRAHRRPRRRAGHGRGRELGRGGAGAERRGRADARGSGFRVRHQREPPGPGGGLLRGRREGGGDARARAGHQPRVRRARGERFRHRAQRRGGARNRYPGFTRKKRRLRARRHRRRKRQSRGGRVLRASPHTRARDGRRRRHRPPGRYRFRGLGERHVQPAFTAGKTAAAPRVFLPEGRRRRVSRKEEKQKGWQVRRLRGVRARERQLLS
mmetsp:Transcript_4412/g.17601  ORF Transcript_4412/g.17601 Transcript_4412/m.17601 type:complete len:264 (+) Transcript_4412:116-907(+)